MKKQGLNLNYEKRLWRRGFVMVAGIDEAGRGPLAGPVAVGMVIIPVGSDLDRRLVVRDSKILSAKERGKIFEVIKRECQWAVGMVSARMIDKKGISWAIKSAVEKAKKIIEKKAEGEINYFVADYGITMHEGEVGVGGSLVGGIRGVGVKVENFVKGDDKIFSVACAAVAAKVTRDAWMRRQAVKYPNYGFEKHKGYGTKEHYGAIKKYGLCFLHRKSYSLEKFAK